MKYIIKNCPVFNNKHQICNKKSKVISCKDISDCVMKQIMEKCKMNMSDDGFKYVLEHKNDEGIIWLTDSSKALLNILQLLEIEECE